MLGLAGSVAVLKALEASHQPEVLIIPIWAAVHAVHVVLRYRSLAALRFPYPNQRRCAGCAPAAPACSVHCPSGCALLSTHAGATLAPLELQLRANASVLYLCAGRRHWQWHMRATRLCRMLQQ